MIQISEPEESESLKKNVPLINYRFNRKFDFMNTHSQLYISNSQLKIIINCIPEFSKDIISYSNSFSIDQLQKINKYYENFNKIEDILEDTANLFNQLKYDLERSGSKLNLILHSDINDELLDIKLKLNKGKNNDIDSSKIIKNRKILYDKPNNIEEYEQYPRFKNSNHNVGVKSMNELNNILNDLKDRLTVLEVTQNTSNNQPISDYNKNNKMNNNYNRNIINTGNSSFSQVRNENILILETILNKIDKLEKENYKKDEKINQLEEKIRYYEPTFTAMSDNDSINDNNAINLQNNYNNNNNNDNNDVNQDLKYINLGSIKNVDTSTITSTNSQMKTGLLEIKEEINNSFSKQDNNKKKKEIKIPSEDSYQYNKDSNINISENKGKTKEKLNKSQTKQVKMDNNNDNNEFPNSSKKKKKGKGKKVNNNEEEIENTDFNNLKKSLTNIKEYDNQKLINKMENDLNKKNKNKKKSGSGIKSKKSKKVEINNNNININNEIKDNNINSNSNSSGNENNNINNNINNINNQTNNNINNNKNISSSNSNEENNNNLNMNQIIPNNSSSQQLSEIDENLIQKNKELELQREIEEKEERRRRQKTFKETSSGDSSLKVKQLKKSLTMLPKQNLTQFCKSHIIFTRDELKLLKNKLNLDKRLYSVFFDVLYRASEDGDNTEFAKKVMEKERKTLTLFQTEKGARFGIYVEKKEDTTILMTKYLAERPGTSFLVSLNNLEIYDIYKTFVSSENKLCFIKNKKSNKNGTSYAIFTPPQKFLGVQCYMGDITAYFNVDGNEDVIGEKEEYKLKEVEICRVAIEKRQDPDINILQKSKTEIPKNMKQKYSYGREYSFKNQEDSSQEDNKIYSEENKNRNYNKDDEETIKDRLNCDYYDSGIIKGSEE